MTDKTKNINFLVSEMAMFGFSPSHNLHYRTVLLLEFSGHPKCRRTTQQQPGNKARKPDPALLAHGCRDGPAWISSHRLDGGRCAGCQVVPARRDLDGIQVSCGRKTSLRITGHDRRSEPPCNWRLAGNVRSRNGGEGIFLWATTN